MMGCSKGQSTTHSKNFKDKSNGSTTESPIGTLNLTVYSANDLRDTKFFG